MATVKSTVTGRGDDLKRLEAYLYVSTSVSKYAFDGERFTATLVTENDDADRATYLANYQAGRLQSGLFGVQVGEVE